MRQQYIKGQHISINSYYTSIIYKCKIWQKLFITATIHNSSVLSLMTSDDFILLPNPFSSITPYAILKAYFFPNFQNFLIQNFFLFFFSFPSFLWLNIGKNFHFSCDFWKHNILRELVASTQHNY